MLTWDEAQEKARMERTTAADLELAAGHVFGENTEVPTSAIISHRSGIAIDGVFEEYSAPIPYGTDPADATETAVNFELRRSDDPEPDAEEWKEDEDGFLNFELENNTSSDSDDEVTRRRGRSRSRLSFLDDGDSGSEENDDDQAQFSPCGSDSNQSDEDEDEPFGTAKHQRV